MMPGEGQVANTNKVGQEDAEFTQEVASMGESVKM